MCVTINIWFDTSIILLSQVFSHFGLTGETVDSNRGTHFSAAIMTELWWLLGVKAKLHIAYDSRSSGRVERSNKTIIRILRKYVAANHKDWDLKLRDQSHTQQVCGNNTIWDDRLANDTSTTFPVPTGRCHSSHRLHGSSIRDGLAKPPPDYLCIRSMKDGEKCRRWQDLLRQKGLTPGVRGQG